METPEYKKERLRDLTGIEDEQKLFEIYYQLKQLFLRVGLDNLKYRRNTVDDRNQTETEFAILNLNGEDMIDFEEILKELRIYGFPEPVSGTNYSNLVIDNRRDMEVLRLMSVFKDLDRALEERERQKRIQEEAEAYVERMRKVEEERIARLEAQEKIDAERRLKDEIEKAKREKVLELQRKWDAEKQQFQAKRDEEKQRIDAIVDEVLAKIKPQDIDLDVEIDELRDPFYDIAKFGGYQPRLPRERSRIRRPEVSTEAQDFLEEMDPIELDEKMDRYKVLWESGEIVDLEEEPMKLPGGRVDLSIFPKKFVWRLDKKVNRKKCYEYDSATRKVGREIDRKERDAYILRLKELRDVRFKKEEEQKTKLPKSKEEAELEQKVILTMNNLIVWLVNDLTSNLRGNMELRNIKANDADDLYQNAILGLFYAIDNHDPQKAIDGKIIPYVMACMEGHIRRTHWEEHGIAGQKEQIRVPSHLVDVRRKIQRMQRQLRSQYSDETDDRKMEARLAEALSRPEVGVLPTGSGVAELRRLRERLLMDYEEAAFEILDGEHIDIDTQMSKLAELLYAEPTQELYMERMHLKDVLNKLLVTLTPREERVLRLRFFPQGYSPAQLYTSTGAPEMVDGMTLEETAVALGVTRERIRQIEAKAIRKLKHPSRNKPILAYQQG